MADLAQAIEVIESIAGGHRLVKRFARGDQYSGAVFEVDVAAVAMRRDLSIRLEAPPQPHRNCDMAVSRRRDGNTTTPYIEAQVVQDYGTDTPRNGDCGPFGATVRVGDHAARTVGSAPANPQ